MRRGLEFDLFSHFAKGVATLGLVVTLVIFSYIMPSLAPLPSFGLKAYYSLVSVLAGLAVYFFLMSASSRLKEDRQVFMFRKFSATASVALSLLAVMVIWVQEVTVLAFSIGLVAAGVSFSLKDPITSLVGWLVMVFERPFMVGDRISINQVEGDVVDYGFFFVKVMEIGQWTEGNLYTGRFLLIPTNWILSYTIYNYTRDFPFIWDRIWVGLLYGADFEKVGADLLKIVKDGTAPIMSRARRPYKELTSRYVIAETSVEPQLYISFNSNWIEFNLRYLTETHTRTATKSMLSTKILEYLTHNKVSVASSSMNITLFGNKD